MKFSEKMCFKTILKVTKSQGFTFSLEDSAFENPQIEPLPLPPNSRFKVKTSSFE